MAKTKPNPEQQGRQRYGVNVKKARLAARLTQTELGRKVGVSVSQISFIERGEHWSSQWVYRKICRVLGVGVPPLMS